VNKESPYPAITLRSLSRTNRQFRSACVIALLLGWTGATEAWGQLTESQGAVATEATRQPAAVEGGQVSPQGPPGPLDTRSGGAPASSPQGETPAGMQSKPSSAGDAGPAAQDPQQRNGSIHK
jgi:hypothetical protein